MSIEGESENGFTASGPPDRPAAPWAWPVLIASIVLIGWSAQWFGSSGERARSEAAPTSNSDLALLEIQSQVVIAGSGLDPKPARQALKQMRETVEGDAGVVAVALLERFVDLSGVDPRETLDRLSEDAREGRLGYLAEKAIDEGIEPEEREWLRERVAGFADLAPAAGAEEAPGAGDIRERATVVIGLMGLLAVVAILGVLAGAALLIGYLRAGRGVNHFRSEAGPRGVMLECVALYLGLMAAGEMGARLVHPGLAIVGYVVASVFPLVWPMFRGVSWGDFRRSLGWHRGGGWIREIAAGVVGYLGVMAIACIGVFLTLVLSWLVGLASSPADADGGGGGAPAGPQSHPIVGWIFTGGLEERLLALLLASGLAPLLEETFFRGALHRYLRGRLRFFPSALATGVIFASLHPQGWLAIPALGAIGIGFSLLREWRDSLIAPMTAHAINNGALLLALCLVL